MFEYFQKCSEIVVLNEVKKTDVFVDLTKALKGELMKNRKIVQYIFKAMNTVLIMYLLRSTDFISTSNLQSDGFDICDP